MHDDIHFKTEVDCGFNLPSAYRSHNDRLNHMVVIAVLLASTAIAAIMGVQIAGLI